jgi:hypothetical protein
LVDEHTRAHEGLEWFGPPGRNTLLHCVIYCESEALSLDLSCNVACLPFYSWRGACTKALSPDMWAQRHREYNTWDYKYLLSGQSPCVLSFEILCIFGVQGKLLVEGITQCAAWHGRTVRKQTQQACRVLDDPDAACQRMGRDALNAERARRPSAQWQAARPLLNKCRGCTTLSQAWPDGLCHGPQAAGFCLSGKWRARPGDVPVPDPYSRQGPPRSGTLLRFGPYSEAPDLYV